MNDAQVEAVAAALTPAQRSAVINALYSPGHGAWHPAGWYVSADRRVRYRLACANPCRDYLRAANPLTKFGEQVRALLTARTGDRA